MRREAGPLSEPIQNFGTPSEQGQARVDKIPKKRPDLRIVPPPLPVEAFVDEPKIPTEATPEMWEAHQKALDANLANLDRALEDQRKVEELRASIYKPKDAEVVEDPREKDIDKLMNLSFDALEQMVEPAPEVKLRGRSIKDLERPREVPTIVTKPKPLTEEQKIANRNKNALEFIQNEIQRGFSQISDTQKVGLEDLLREQQSMAERGEIKTALEIGQTIEEKIRRMIEDNKKLAQQEAMAKQAQRQARVDRIILTNPPKKPNLLQKIFSWFRSK